MSDQTALEEYRDAAEAIRIQVAPRSWSSRAILALWDALEAAQAREEGGAAVLCENYHEISMVQGPHCYNCARRDGWPWMGRPTNACANFKPTALAASGTASGTASGEESAFSARLRQTTADALGVDPSQVKVVGPVEETP